MHRKTVSAPVKTSRRARIRNVPHLYSAVCGTEKLPRAAYEGCVLVPFALTALIPENAVRKFAAHEPFAVHIDDFSEPFSVYYFGDGHFDSSLLPKYYQRKQNATSRI